MTSRRLVPGCMSSRTTPQSPHPRRIVPDLARTPRGSLLRLQQTVGNQAVQRLLQRGPADAPAQGASDPDQAESSAVGSLVEGYPIQPGTTDGLDPRITSEDQTVGDVNTQIYTVRSTLTLTKKGLRAHLAQLANGQLEPFEERLIESWGDSPSAWLTPLMRIGDEGIAGYVLDSSASSGGIRTLYSRGGELLLTQYLDEKGVVSEGLGPLEWVWVVGGIAAIGRLALAKYAAKRAAAAEAAAIESKKIFLPDSEAVIAVIKDGEIIASAHSGTGHPEFVQRALGYTKETLPRGLEVVTIGKLEGKLVALRSQTFHGNMLPASFAAQEAARRVYR
jgi:hypothetical protein